MVFKEPIYQVHEKIKNESYFKWPNKMGETPPNGIKTCIANIIEIEAI